MLEMKNASISELNLRIISMEETNNDETLLWRIGGLQRRRQEAIGGRVNSLSSSVFYTRLDWSAYRLICSPTALHISRAPSKVSQLSRNKYMYNYRFFSTGR